MAAVYSTMYRLYRVSHVLPVEYQSANKTNKNNKNIINKEECRNGYKILRDYIVNDMFSNK